MSSATMHETHNKPWETEKDYGLCSPRSQEVVDKGLAEAEWYRCPIKAADMQALLQRRNWPALRDCTIWFGLLLGSAAAGMYLWGTWWAILPFMVYGAIYGGSADSRWHESSHGTAFKTDWLNNVLYEIASFMVMRNSCLWRWSHTRHHSDTIIVGRDPEIASPRPPSFFNQLLGSLGIPQARAYFSKLLRHVVGVLAADEKDFVPQDQWSRVVWTARVHALIYAATIGAALYWQSFLPLLLIGLPSLYGAWMMVLYGFTQHAGLAENVLDHRLNCRTVKMNIVNRFFYWNMNYHIEHHMFPLVPYHQLPKLHALMKDDCPPPYTSIFAAWKEIVWALRQQQKDVAFYVPRPLPQTAQQQHDVGRAVQFQSANPQATSGWVSVCDASELRNESVIRFDHGEQTFAIYRTSDGQCYATAGMCTHGKIHLAEGLVKGTQIECPKHNGRFDVRDGSPQRKPVCKHLQTFAIREYEGLLQLQINSVVNDTAAACQPS